MAMVDNNLIFGYHIFVIACLINLCAFLEVYRYIKEGSFYANFQPGLPEQGLNDGVSESVKILLRDAFVCFFFICIFTLF